MRREHWRLLHRAGVRAVPCNTVSLGDRVLDTVSMLGLVPRRHRGLVGSLERYAAMLSGVREDGKVQAIAALQRAPWLQDGQDVVPELEPGMQARLDADRLFSEIEDAHEHGFEPYPVVLGPVSFLLGACMIAPHLAGRGPLSFLETVLDAYAALFMLLGEDGIRWVQLDEPSLGTELDDATQAAFLHTFGRLSTLTSRPAVLLTGCKGYSPRALSLAAGSGFECLHTDLVHRSDSLENVLEALPQHMRLSAGIVSGEGALQTDFGVALAHLCRATARLGPDRVLVAPSCPVSATSVRVPSQRAAMVDDNVSATVALLQQLARAAEL